MRRYDKAKRGARNYKTWAMNSNVRRAALRGEFPVRRRILKEGERLDQIAGELWGDAQLWWVIAACSGIGWWLQTPAGTELLIPEDPSVIEEVI